MTKIKASLGIDIGTSGTKLVLVDYSGEQRAYFYQDYDIDIPRQGWAEQDPETWYRAVHSRFNLHTKPGKPAEHYNRRDRDERSDAQFNLPG